MRTRCSDPRRPAWSAYDGVQEQRTVQFLHRTLGQLLVHAVQRVARLEGDDVAMPHGREPGAGLRRRQTQLAEIIVRRKLQARSRPEMLVGP